MRSYVLLNSLVFRGFGADGKRHDDYEKPLPSRTRFISGQYINWCQNSFGNHSLIVLFIIFRNSPSKFKPDARIFLASAFLVMDSIYLQFPGNSLLDSFYRYSYNISGMFLKYGSLYYINTIWLVFLRPLFLYSLILGRQTSRTVMGKYWNGHLFYHSKYWSRCF